MKKRYVVLIVILIVLIGAFIAGKIVMSNLEANLKQLSDIKIQNVDLTKVEDGTYTGSYQAFPVSAEVKVTVKNHMIEVIELVKHNNGQGAPAEVITDKVVKEQTLVVDIISGATYSSKVILKAIEDALNKAGQ